MSGERKTLQREQRGISDSPQKRFFLFVRQIESIEANHERKAEKNASRHETGCRRRAKKRKQEESRRMDERQPAASSWSLDSYKTVNGFLNEMRGEKGNEETSALHCGDLGLLDRGESSIELVLLSSRSNPTKALALRSTVPVVVQRLTRRSSSPYSASGCRWLMVCASKTSFRLRWCALGPSHLKIFTVWIDEVHSCFKSQSEVRTKPLGSVEKKVFCVILERKFEVKIHQKFNAR